MSDIASKYTDLSINLTNTEEILKILTNSASTLYMEVGKY